MNQNQEYLTLDEYVSKQIKKRPILYVSTSWEDAKLKVCDQIFNVIGNAVDTKSSFLKEIQRPKDYIDEKLPEHYVNEEPVFWGFEKVKDRVQFKDGRVYESPDFDSMIKGVFAKSEIDELIKEGKIVTSLDVKKETKVDFYPNFQKEYSIVWKLNFNNPSLESYRDGAKWFYEKAKEYFLSEESSSYNYALPKAPKERLQRVSDMSNYLKKYDTIEDLKERYKKISEDYGTEFSGDVELFLETKWQKERKEILDFIDETIEMLSPELKNQKIVKVKV